MQLKLFLTYILLSFLALSLAGVLISSSERKHSLAQLEQSMIFETQLLANIFASPLSENLDLMKTDSLADQLGRTVQGRITIIDKNGKVVADSYESGQALLNMENHKNRPEVKDALQGKSGKSIRYSYTIKEDMLYVASPVKVKGNIIGTVRLAFPLTEMTARQNIVFKLVLLGLVVAFIFSLFLSFGFSFRVSRPLRQMMQVGKLISRGDFSQKVKVKTKDEIGELAEILNQMSTELSQKIEQITQDRSQMQSILSSMVEGVMAIDPKGKLLLANSALCEMFGLDQSSYGRFYYELIRSHELNQFIRMVLSARVSQKREISFIHPEEKDFLVQSAPAEKPKEGSVSAILVFHEITELKKTERIRKDFVANVSHELRTPLTSIKGFVEALKDGAVIDPEKSARFLSIISQHSDRMNKIISDLLQLSQIESEDFELKIEPLSVRELFEEVTSVLRPLAAEKSQKIEIALYSETQKVIGDKYRIIQALTNLVDNAIKYTPEKGSIKIESRDKDNSVEIAVIDNGIGIQQKNLPRVFERFYRVDKDRSRESGGTGLGLSIVKHIIEAHGGKVGVKSDPGRGSEFSFRLKKA